MTGPGSRFLLELFLNPPVRQETRVHDPLWTEFLHKPSWPKRGRTLTRTPGRLAVRLGPGGTAVQDGEGLVVLDARNLALLLRQEGRGRVFFAGTGHPVPQRGAAGSAGRSAERIELSHGGQFNGTDTDVERQANRPTNTAPRSGSSGDDHEPTTSGKEKAEAETLPLYPGGVGGVGEPKG